MSIDPFSMTSEEASGLAAVQKQLGMIANDPDMVLVTRSLVYECLGCIDSKEGCPDTCERVKKYRKP